MELSRRNFLAITGATVATSLGVGIGIGFVARDRMTESDIAKNYDRKFNEHNYTMSNLADAVDALKFEMLVDDIFDIKIGGQYSKSIIFLLSFINSATDRSHLAHPKIIPDNLQMAI